MYAATCCCLVVEIANLEDELKELELTIEREHEEHKTLVKQKEKEYVETEEQLTADNQQISTHFHTLAHCVGFVYFSVLISTSFRLLTFVTYYASCFISFKYLTWSACYALSITVQSSVRPSVCLSRRSTAAAGAGLLLSSGAGLQ